MSVNGEIQAQRERMRKELWAPTAVGIQIPTGAIPHPDGSMMVPVRDGIAELERLSALNAGLQEELAKVKSTHFEFKRELQPYIDHMPKSNEELYGQACTGDKVTVDSWRPTWIKNIRLNAARFGGFRKQSISTVYEQFVGGSAIVVGSGPALKRNGHLLRLTKQIPFVPVISALHNFGYLMDLGAKVDYWMTLDAGPIVISEVYEGGSKKNAEGQIDEEYYWSLTEDQTLVAFVGSDPGLFEKWRGPVLLFSAGIPDDAVQQELQAVEPNFHHFISSGGNVLGGATYFARGILGCCTIAWVGNSQSFDYNHDFYGWPATLNGNAGGTITWPDIYGLPVKTWPSYFNFKCWFDYLTNTMPSNWINATEGGIIGSYPQGNIRSIRQMALMDVLTMFKGHQILTPVMDGTTSIRPAGLEDEIRGINEQIQKLHQELQGRVSQLRIPILF